MASAYEIEWERQRGRTDIPAGHLPGHRWYLRLDCPADVAPALAPCDGLSLVRAHKPTIAFYRFLYHTAGEAFLWADRRQMSDGELEPLIVQDAIHLMVLYLKGTPAGFFELLVPQAGDNDEPCEVKYFALLPGFIGKGLGSFMLTRAINYAAEASHGPLILDTCTLDHGAAFENYKKRGFVVYREEDYIYPDPRLDGTMPVDCGAHVPLATRA